MQKTVNLIPDEMSVPDKVVRLSGTLEKINKLVVISLVLIVLSLISGFVYFNFEYKKSVDNVEQLRNQVANLEKSEQKLVLAKDKLGKITTVMKIDSIDDELDSFEDFEKLVSNAQSGSFSEVALSPAKTEATLAFSNTDSISAVLRSLPQLSEYRDIILSAFSFNSNSGYLVSLIFDN